MKSIILVALVALWAAACETPENSTGSDIGAPPPDYQDTASTFRNEPLRSDSAQMDPMTEPQPADSAQRNRDWPQQDQPSTNPGWPQSTPTNPSTPANPAEPTVPATPPATPSSTPDNPTTIPPTTNPPSSPSQPGSPPEAPPEG